MKELIVDSLAVYGGYSLVKHVWKKHKKAIVQKVTNYIVETIKESMTDGDNPLSINITLGGDK